jgi:hypothetical protein
LGVQDGARAKAIVGEMDRLKTNKEKKAYLKDLIQKKVISESVFEQIEYLLKNK